MKTTPLTQNQQLLWIGQEFAPKSPMYNMAMTYEIHGSISTSHFKLAFQKLVAKSDALRSVFKIENGVPVQKYLPNVEAKIEIVDFSNTENPKKAYQDWQSKRIAQPFDLENSLVDCVLIQLSDNLFIWYINCHHLITDGVTSTLLLEEMSVLYKEAIKGSFDAGRTLPLFSEFSDYIENQKKTDAFKKTVEYWNEKKQSFPKNLPPLYFKNKINLSTATKRIEVPLGEKRTQQLLEFAQEKGIRGWTVDLTLYNIFLTALYSFVYRISGQHKLLIGAPTHNRVSSSFKKTIGFFVEVFPLLVEVAEEETFFSLFKKVQLESNNFLKYAKAGCSSADINRNFNVFFNYMLNAKNTDFNGMPVKTTWEHPGHTDPRHLIRIHVHDFDNTGEIKLYIDLNTSVFSEEECYRIPKHFLKLLDAFVANKEQEIETTSFITESERSQIVQWNSTNKNFTKNETLLSKFTKQVQKTPEATALIFNDTKLTYKEFDAKSSQVANWLISKNIKPQEVVVVSLERSLEMMIYTYGIIKAGAIYLPVDTNTPEKRLQFIIEDVQAKGLFYNHNKISVPQTKENIYFEIASIADEIEQISRELPQIIISESDIAYIIYTSGSTGTPKGVKCHHKGICNRLNWMLNDYPMSDTDVFLQKTPITFDVSLWELFIPLQIGAPLVIEIPDGHKDPDQLIKTIQKNKVSYIHFVPSMLNVFIQNENVENCTTLQWVLCSGEALSVSVVEKTYKKLNVEVYNLYGPTEASVEVTNWHCKKEELSKGIPIGTPVANTQLYILDKNNNPLPIGIPGELHIAGVQVAGGYVNREELTKERFVKDIFSESPEAKMYKTGDLTRYREDGAIEYLGRIDNQLKIRGQRIELGEIEKNIEQYEGISQSVVIVHQDNLVAYYTGSEVSIGKLINFLNLKLPLYMIPFQFIKLENFEYLSSGKVNRKKLPAIILEKENIDKTYLAPQNEIQEIILDAWKEVLEIENIGIDENFIRIGGNSLHAISITSRLKRIFELDLSITEIFNYPTIIKYASHVEEVITKLLNGEVS